MNYYLYANEEEYRVYNGYDIILQEFCEYGSPEENELYGLYNLLNISKSGDILYVSNPTTLQWCYKAKADRMINYTIMKFPYLCKQLNHEKQVKIYKNNIAPSTVEEVWSKLEEEKNNPVKPLPKLAYRKFTVSSGVNRYQSKNHKKRKHNNYYDFNRSEDGQVIPYIPKSPKADNRITLEEQLEVGKKLVKIKKQFKQWKDLPIKHSKKYLKKQERKAKKEKKKHLKAWQLQQQKYKKEVLDTGYYKIKKNLKWYNQKGKTGLLKKYECTQWHNKKK